MRARTSLSIILLLTAFLSAKASYPVEYRGEVIANAGSGDFAPYYIASNNFGILTQPYSVLARASARRGMEMEKRLVRIRVRFPSQHLHNGPSAASLRFA